MPLRHLAMSLEFKRKSEDEATNVKILSKWMLWKAIGLGEDIYGWRTGKRRGPFQNMGHITI